MSKYRYQITWLAEIDHSAISRRFEDQESQIPPRSFTYTYGGQPVELDFSLEKVTLTLEKTTIMKQKAERNLISDILEKIYIVYTILYSTGFDPYHIEISLTKYDGRKKAWTSCQLPSDTYLTVHNLTAAFMVNGIFAPDVVDFDASTWKSDEWISSYINKRNADFTFEQKNLKSALYAWIASKNKKIPGERFQYLWIAFNCLYFYFGRVLRQRITCELTDEEREMYQILKTLKVLDKDFQIAEQDIQEVSVYARLASYSTADSTALSNYAMLMCLPEIKLSRKPVNIEKVWVHAKASSGEVDRRRKKETGEIVLKYINQYWNGDKITAESLRQENHILAEKIAELLSFDGVPPEAAYRYLIEVFLYNNLRCQVFHGNMPIPLFSSVNDKYLKAYQLANGIIEDQLETCLFRCISIDQKGAPGKENADYRLSIIDPDNQQLVQKVAASEANKIRTSIQTEYRDLEKPSASDANKKQKKKQKQNQQ